MDQSAASGFEKSMKKVLVVKVAVEYADRLSDVTVLESEDAQTKAKDIYLLSKVIQSGILESYTHDDGGGTKSSSGGNKLLILPVQELDELLLKVLNHFIVNHPEKYLEEQYLYDSTLKWVKEDGGAYTPHSKTYQIPTYDNTNIWDAIAAYPTKDPLLLLLEMIDLFPYLLEYAHPGADPIQRAHLKKFGPY